MHVVLDHQDRVAALVAQTPDQLGDLVVLVGVHPGRRLVEQQQPRAGRHRARDLQAPAVGVGQDEGRLVEAVALQTLPEEAEHVLGPGIDLGSSRRARGSRRIDSTGVAWVSP